MKTTTKWGIIGKIAVLCGCSMVFIGCEKASVSDISENGNQEQNFYLSDSKMMPQNAECKVIEQQRNPVISPYGKESWESLDVLNPSVINWNGKYYNYYSGWDGETWRTGLAVSNDGIIWERSDKNPVLNVRPDNWDKSYIAANGSAIVYNNKVYYYYHGKSEETGGAAIGLAISENGEDFTERTDTPVLNAGETGTWDCVSVADPYVIEYDGKLYMYYLGQDSVGRQRLGVAMSENGKDWVKNVNNPILNEGTKGSFDEKGLGEPSVIYQYPYFYMLYTGRNVTEQRNVGMAISLDGVNWKKMNYSGLFDLSENVWSNQVICDTTFAEQENGNVMVWYGGGNIASPDENLNGNIGMCEMKFDNLMDLTEFDSNADWDNYALDSMDFLKGSYAIEGEKDNRSVWMSEQANIKLENISDADKICIKGEMPFDLYQQINVNEVTLTVWVNGKEMNKKTFQSSEAFEIEIEKTEEIKAEKYIDIEIKASAFVNPQKQGLSDDGRNLSWRLFKIYQK